MTESLRAAAALADRLGGSFDDILPDRQPVLHCEELATDRLELRQIAGISAGGSLELRPGCYDFGPVRRGSGRLGDGEPDTVGFTLTLGDDMAPRIGPGDAPVLVDGMPVLEPIDLAGKVIDAGTARFVVARPRPPRKRGGQAREIRLDAVDPWVLEPIARSVAMGREAEALVSQRRRLHYGPDEIRHRISGGGALLWDRHPNHPLFGTAVVGLADVPLRGDGLEVAAPVPVSVDLLASPTVIRGSRRLQLAVVRHVLLALAAATGPEHLQIGLLSDRDDLDFARRLPHGIDEVARVDAGRPDRSTLLVIDRSDQRGRWAHPAGGSDRTSVLVLADESAPVLLDEALAGSADTIAVIDEATLSVFGGDGAGRIDRATPSGFAHSLAVELAAKLPPAA